MGATFPLISGRYGGKRISVVPGYQPHYDQLEKASNAGQHWARLAVQGLTSLSAGRLNKDNVFVRPNEMVRNGVEEFIVVLPGCKATVCRQVNDEYKVVCLELDTLYFEGSSDNTATGMYRATKDREQWEVRRLSKGRVDQGEEAPSGHHQHIVAVSDQKYPGAHDAAKKMAPLLAKTPGAGSSGFDLFDVHYTGGKDSGTLLNKYRNAVRPLENENVNGSAIMLAKSMYEARKIKKISWVSEFGGSKILTQAMKILADGGVKLEHHHVFLYRPQSSPDAALKEANRLGTN